MTESYPILEYDPSREAIIEPSRLIQPIDVPPHCVLCFFAETVEKLRLAEGWKQIWELKSEMGPHPLYELDYGGRRLVAAHPRVGAPLAAATLEALIALGCRRFVVCGGAGVLDGEIAAGHVVVPTSAVRDEGTSYHYLPPSREVSADPRVVETIRAVLVEKDVPHVLGKTWTTDAFFRETRDKIRRRRAEGCLTVEMEAATFFAVAAFRGATLGQILYAGDDVSGPEWDPRAWNTRVPIRERLFHLAAEACLRLE